MTYATDPAKSAGPTGDGSKSLAKESKAGLAVTVVIFWVGQGVVDGINGLDTSAWHGWWASAAVGALATASGLITAYLKKNR
jgi:uncharacterized membrane protein HdeD (DUF308 family)